jgi:DNA-directed RNA polymerase specialized sigma24 family protein
MTYEQIAAAVNIPIGTVKTRMRLALTRLRETFAVNVG